MVPHIFTLRQAGIPYTRTPDLTKVLGELTAHGRKAYVYGGYPRDTVCLGSTSRSGDIDVAMSLDDFLALKNPERDVRKMFTLHEPHLLFMLHQMQDDVFKNNARPIVLKLKPDIQADWGLSHPVGLTLFQNNVPLADLVHDSDLGFCHIVDDGADVWIADAFQNDFFNHTMMMIRAADARAYARTIRRMEDFMTTGYDGWKTVIPPELYKAFHKEAQQYLA